MALFGQSSWVFLILRCIVARDSVRNLLCILILVVHNAATMGATDRLLLAFLASDKVSLSDASLFP